MCDFVKQEIFAHEYVNVNSACHMKFFATARDFVIYSIGDIIERLLECRNALLSIEHCQLTIFLSFSHMMKRRGKNFSKPIL